MTSVSRLFVGLAVAALTGSVTFVAGSSVPAAPPVIVAQTTEGSATGPVVVGIGDSILGGHGLAVGQSWVSDLALQYGWRLTNFASDGSGFVTIGDNGDTFADQVATAVQLAPDVVFISGSSNDLGSDDESIREATVATITSIRAALPHTRIIAVSAIWGDTAAPAQLNQVSTYVASAVYAVGGTYLEIGQPLSARPEFMQSDDGHPTADGQLAIASAVATVLGVLQPSLVGQ